MKRTLLSVSICLMCIPVFSQWTSNGNIISTTQNVGIGTTTPIFKLDVNGDIRVKKNYYASWVSVNPGFRSHISICRP